MKKNFFFILNIVLCVMFFVACSSDKDKTSETANTTDMATAGNADGTRGYSVHRIDGTNLYLVTENNQQCVKNDTGKVVIPPVCNINIFDQGFIAITDDNKYGAYDRTGKCLLEPKYQDAIFSGKLICVTSDKGSAAFNLSGKQLTEFGEYDVFETFKGKTSFFAAYAGDAACMLFDYNGNKLLPATAEEISWNGYDECKYVFYRINGKLGMYNEKVLLSPEFDDIDVKDNYIVVKKFQKQRLLSAKGEPLTDWVEEISEENSRNNWDEIIGYSLINNNLRGYISADGKVSLPVIYDHFEITLGNYLQVRKDGKDQLMTMSGQRLLSADKIDVKQTVFINDTDSTGHYLNDAIVTINGKQGVYSLSRKKMLIPAIYDKVEYTWVSRNLFWAVINNGKHGLLSYTGATVLSVAHEVLGCGTFKGMKNQCFVAGKKGNFGLYDLKGKFIKKVNNPKVYIGEGDVCDFDEADYFEWPEIPFFDGFQD